MLVQVPPVHDMVDSSGIFDAQRSGHVSIIPPFHNTSTSKTTNNED
jgi:hypothetical protein